MVKGEDCPPWCAEHVVGSGAGQHRVVLGDVRLTLSGASDAWQATCAVRRRARRTAAQVAELTAHMSVVGDLLRRACGRRHVLHGNTVYDPALSAAAKG